MFTCTRCGTFGCAECAFSAVRGREVCRACAESGLAEAIPWERRREVGTWRAFWRTARLVLTQPARFFRTPTTHDDVLAAVAHGVLSMTVGLFLTYVGVGLLLALAGGGVAAFAPEPDAEPIGAVLGTYGCTMVGASPFLALLAGPANALVGIAFAAACAHGTLALVKKTRGSFEDTVRVVAYANAPYLLQSVPLFGLFTWFWVVGVEAVGLREVHGCGTDWAVAAALGYRLALVVAIVASYAAFFLGLFYLGSTR